MQSPNKHIYLIKACAGNEISKYHLEASIAYWHTTSIENNKWEKILQLYNQLLIINYSPVAALNRAFAVSKVYGRKVAIIETEKLDLTTNHYYYSLLGFLYSTIDQDKAINHFKQSINLSNSDKEKNLLNKTIMQLEREKNSS